MKAALLFGLAAALLLAACSGNSGTNDEAHALEISKVAPRPTARMAERAGEPLERIGIGHSIFERKCLECHAARVPKNPADPNWHPIITGMSWNAGLSDQEMSYLMSYLRAVHR